MRFAREALFGARHTLPGWYPHEVLGSPFFANLQSFPWIPTRLLVLLLDPSMAYAAAIAIAAGLSAFFTYLYGRRAGLTRAGAGGSRRDFRLRGILCFACDGRTLPLLEAYPALPLLLWLVDRTLAPERAQRRKFDLGALAFATACVVVAGHPQLPAYAVASALLYTFWKRRGAIELRVAGAIALGAGATLAVWWPMLLLIARSTRAPPLCRPTTMSRCRTRVWGRLSFRAFTVGHSRWIWRTRIVSADFPTRPISGIQRRMPAFFRWRRSSHC